jgi:HK97 family phage major capsid protein
MLAKKKAALAAQLSAKHKQISDILAMDDLSDEKRAEADRLESECSVITRDLERVETAMERQRAALSAGSVAETVTGAAADGGFALPRGVSITIPARAKRWSGRLRAFKGPEAESKAFKAGMFLAAVITGVPAAVRFCREHGIMTEKVALDAGEVNALHSEGVNTAGGYLVFEEYETDIIRLVEDYGLARRKMRLVPMLSDVKNRPRRTGGLEAYFIGEGDDGTESTGSWDNVKLIAKKLGAIATCSNELYSDAIIAIADEITREIALALATKEDLCGFQGTGTSTYGGIVGLVSKLSTINGVDDGGGLVLGSGNLYSEITDIDLLKMVGRLPNYPGIEPEWYCSKTFWATVMMRLVRASGGATMMDMAGRLVPQYAGYPVNFTSGTTAMPAAEANSQICCLFGDMRMAADFGDRQGMTIAMSSDATVDSRKLFQSDSFAIRGIERFDINCHDVGSSTAAGPMIGLITAAG